MKNLKLWMEAIAEELEKVHVSGREDIATMNKVFNTLKKLEEEAASEDQNEQGA